MEGFINENILKSVSIKKWNVLLFGILKFLNSFNSVYTNTDMEDY